MPRPDIRTRIIIIKRAQGTPMRAAVKFKKDTVRRIGIKKKRLYYRLDYFILYGMIAVPIVYYIIFHYLPMVGILIAFADYRVSGFKEWVGLDNFRFIFKLPFFWKSFINTWVFVLFRYIFLFPAPIILALLLNELRFRRYKKLVQTVSTLPHFISWVVIAGIWISLLSPTTGYVNEIIKFFGGEPIFFMSKSRLFPFLFTFLRGWKGIGYSAIIYLAALAGVNPELYESAVIDGASRLKQALYITIPSIRPIILVVFVLSFTHVLTLFEPIYVLKNPMIQSSAEVIDTYVYNLGVVQAKFPLATAVGLFKSTISLVMVIIANILSKNLTEDKRGIL
jgi:putative aldouronate transport system permease protein